MAPKHLKVKTSMWHYKNKKNKKKIKNKNKKRKKENLCKHLSQIQLKWKLS